MISRYYPKGTKGIIFVTGTCVTRFICGRENFVTQLFSSSEVDEGREIPNICKIGPSSPRKQNVILQAGR